MDFDWSNSHNRVLELLRGIEPQQVVIQQLTNLLNRFLLESESTYPARKQLSKSLTSFFEIPKPDQYFLLQVVSVLGLAPCMDILSNLLLSTEESSISKRNWKRILALVSSIIIALRGGVSSLRGLIHRLLCMVFAPAPTAFMSSDLTAVEFMELPSDESIADTSSFTNPTVDNDEVDLFATAILLARQLCVEDIRLTGFTYSQWWSDSFCSPSTEPSQFGKLLHARAHLFRLADLLIELLPYECDPRLLQLQLTSRPLYLNRAPGCNSNSSKQDPFDRISEEAFLSVSELQSTPAEKELHSLDTAYNYSCTQRWNDYVEIGHGRLAELRNSFAVLERTQTLNIGASTDFEVDPSTPGWNEVLEWLQDIARQLSTNSGCKTHVCRVPHILTEVNLFQPRRLRSVLIPALLHANELEHLAPELKNAHTHLLSALKEAGLGHLLETPEDIRPKLPQCKRGNNKLRTRRPRGSVLPRATKRTTKQKNTVLHHM